MTCLFVAAFLAPFHYLLLTIGDTTFRVLGGLFLLVFAGALWAAAIYTQTRPTPPGQGEFPHRPADATRDSCCSGWD